MQKLKLFSKIFLLEWLGNISQIYPSLRKNGFFDDNLHLLSPKVLELKPNSTPVKIKKFKTLPKELPLELPLDYDYDTPTD
ncbi:hypothetical protein BpHYR1_040101 [Brachionus plicatilis]|uniref:Uncharacterized protein n=1 Tax=Brachionus plicatilis TaxID=10195 RepID=A0A3M7T8Z2_BRAPC|nr:hypothetical protein BpHYR1_040101 [Brachionus plicatilis]